MQAAVDYIKGYPQVRAAARLLLVGGRRPTGAGAHITSDHVRDAIRHTREDLQELYDSRLSRIQVPSEREFVRVMSALGDGPVHRNAIAHELGQAPTSISSTRQALLNAGVIEQAGRGYLQFTVDELAAFARQHFGFSTAVEQRKQYV